MRFIIATIAMACALGSLEPKTARAIEIAPGVSIDAHLRTRFARHDGRDGTTADGAVEYFELRSRLAVDIDAVEWFRAYVQLQDVRVWGEESNSLTDYSANGFDVHQAYGDFRLGTPALVLRLGRQEISLDEERLVGTVAWTPQARSFDAGQLSLEALGGALHLRVFYAQLLDEESIQPGPATNTNTAFAFLSGLHGRYEHKVPSGKLTTSITALVDHHDGIERTRATLGALHSGRFGVFRYRVEGYYQFGELGSEDIRAFMVGADVGVLLESAADLDIRLWADYLSGAETPADGPTRTFDTLFATNHKFYGFADYFIDVPTHTQGKGLVDLALKLSVKPAPQLTLRLDGHYFLPAESRGGPDVFGAEIDVAAAWKPVKYITAMLGVFTMLPDDGLKERLGGSDADVGVYITLQGDI